MRSIQLGIVWAALSMMWPTAVGAAEASSDGPRSLRTDATGERRVLGGGPADIAPDGTIEAVRVETTAALRGKETLYFSTCFAERRPAEGPVERRVLARWNTGQLAPVAWNPHAARYTKDGRFLSVVTVGGVLWLLRDHRPWRRLLQGVPVAEARMVLDAADEPLVFVRRTLSYTLERVTGLGTSETVLEGVDYDWSVGRAATGELYVSGYDYATRTLVIAAARESASATGQAWQWQRLEADTRESGWQHTLASAGDTVFVLTYYYRNAFNRGLNLITLRAGAIAEQHTYLRLSGENGGWAPTMGLLPGGRVFVAHRAREQADAQASAEIFSSIADFQARRAEALTGSWEDDYRSWAVSVAVLPRYRFWSLTSPRPSAATTPLQLSPRYDYEPAFEFGGALEGRLGDWDLGLVYVQSLLGDSAQTGVQLLSGWLGVDQLLFGHDLKLSTSYGTYRGRYRDTNGARSATTPVAEFEIRLLNQWRLGYGLSYRRYTLPLPFYVYRALAGEPDFSFIGGAVAQTTAQRWELFVGYSRIDYLTKYENSFNGLDVDVRGGLGLSRLDWPSARWETTEVDGTMDLALSAHARLGYLVYNRFRSLQGAGFFARAGYEGEWMGSGLDNERPDPRAPDSKELRERQVSVSAAHHQLFHGPYVSFGLAY